MKSGGNAENASITLVSGGYVVLRCYSEGGLRPPFFYGDFYTSNSATTGAWSDGRSKARGALSMRHAVQDLHSAVLART